MKNTNALSLGDLFISQDKIDPESLVIFSSPSDIGVQRNNGRNGARYAPKAIINVLKKFNKHKCTEKIQLRNVSKQENEQKDFQIAQMESAHLLLNDVSINTSKRYIHIGGGHDHAYPLLHGINNSDKFDNILILNIDAHCDTRVSNDSHSGTPFRDFDSIAGKPYHLIQYGLHRYANSATTLSPLTKGSHITYYYDEIFESFDNIFSSCPFEINEKTALFFSLDADSIKGETMKGVSAVNGQGLDIDHVHHMLHATLKYKKPTVFFGIYEYNPVYDDLSQLGARSLSTLLYKFIED